MTKFSAVILAGGQGSRMGHANKGLQTYRGKKLIEHVIDRLSTQVDDIVISANENQDEYLALGYPVVADIEPSQGPLSGILSAASRAQHNQLFITACDMPNLPINIVRELSKAGSPIVMTRSNKGIEPLICTVDREALNQIATCLSQDNYSVMNWLRRVDAKTKSLVHLGPETFYNINTLEELKRSSEN